MPGLSRGGVILCGLVARQPRRTFRNNHLTGFAHLWLDRHVNKYMETHLNQRTGCTLTGAVGIPNPSDVEYDRTCTDYGIPNDEGYSLSEWIRDHPEVLPAWDGGICDTCGATDVPVWQGEHWDACQTCYPW